MQLRAATAIYRFAMVTTINVIRMPSGNTNIYKIRWIKPKDKLSCAFS